jgi:hypothetical protein
MEPIIVFLFFTVMQKYPFVIHDHYNVQIYCNFFLLQYLNDGNLVCYNIPKYKHCINL